ncbi:MAG TPA: TIGR01777 family protein [Myxococcales bacterium]|nr:TIGR01777 family protein [Myxococcales bacterium]
MTDSVWSTLLPHRLEEVFEWHDQPGALQRLLPPWERVEVVASSGHIRAGAEVHLQMRVGPLVSRWHARHGVYEPPHHFEDEAVKSPFAFWRHSHHFCTVTEGTSLEDRVRWRLPFHRAVSWLLTPWVQRRLDAMFAFRHRRTQEDLARLSRYGSNEPITVAITGSSGLVGQNLSALLSTGGHRVISLVRRDSSGDHEVKWDPRDSAMDLSALHGVDVVVHLAGEPLAAGRWSRERKHAIMESRRQGTANLASALARMSTPPKTLISASAIGWYGDREQPVDERAEQGEGFLSDVCEAWERATVTAHEAGIRVVTPRIGVVLDPKHGALGKMLPIWRAGLGGPVGSGEQGFSWVALDDLLAAMLLMMTNSELQGPVNVVSPQKTSNIQFAKALGRVLGRPALVPVPRLAIELLYGQMGRETVLSGAFVVPHKLSEAGFEWSQPDLEDALRFILGRS